MNNNEIKKLFDSINPDENIKEDIYQNIIEYKNKEKNKKNSKFKLSKKQFVFKPAFAFIMIFLFGISVYAVGNNYNKYSMNIIEWSESSDATKLNISDTDKGYKINAESIYGDNKILYLVLSVEREDGKKINVKREDDKAYFWINSEDKIYNNEDAIEIESIRNYALKKNESDMKKLYFLKKYSIDEISKNDITLNGNDLKLEIDRLWFNKFGFATRGSWTLDIPLEYNNLATDYIINEEFEYKNKRNKIEKISISPLDMVLYFSSKEGGLSSFTEEVFENDEFIYFKLDDGKRIDIPMENSTGNNSGDYFNIRYSLVEEDVENIKNIKSIVINDIEIPINF